MGKRRLRTSPRPNTKQHTTSLIRLTTSPNLSQRDSSWSTATPVLWCCDHTPPSPPHSKVSRLFPPRPIRTPGSFRASLVMFNVGRRHSLCIALCCTHWTFEGFSKAYPCTVVLLFLQPSPFFFCFLFIGIKPSGTIPLEQENYMRFLSPGRNKWHAVLHTVSLVHARGLRER